MRLFHGFIAVLAGLNDWSANLAPHSSGQRPQPDAASQKRESTPNDAARLPAHDPVRPLWYIWTLASVRPDRKREIFGALSSPAPLPRQTHPDF